MMEIPRLETERLVLRGPGIQDFEALAAFLASDRGRMVGGPWNRPNAWRFLATLLGHWDLRGYGMWSVDVPATGAFVGQVGMWDPEGWIAPEIAWWIVAPEHEGKGFAFEAALAARRYAYDIAGWREAFSVIRPDNVRSIHLAERLGARLDRTQVPPPNPGGAPRSARWWARWRPRRARRRAPTAQLVYRHPGPEELA
jgi:RimJ/RimL family protein N-acetyltransferase